MGCGYSKSFEQVFNTIQYQQWNKTFIALKISKNEIYNLYKMFQKVDLDHGGTIDVVELLTVIDVERTPFTQRVFAIFDEDNSGKIDFYEFVLSLWNYCTLTRVTLAMFAFDLYDRDSSGLLEDKDLFLMLRDIFGKDGMNSHYAKQTKKDLDEFLSEGEITLDRFVKFTQNHHSLLFPAFQMQLALKKSILGVRFWELCSERRVQLSKNKFVTIKQLIELQALDQPKHQDIKQVQVRSTQGKLAIQSLGIAHNRRLKYSHDESDTDPSSGESHGQSYQSLNSLLPSPSVQGPTFETVGTLSERASLKAGRNTIVSGKSNKVTPLQQANMLDSIMNSHASQKSNKHKGSTKSDISNIKDPKPLVSPFPRPTLPPMQEESSSAVKDDSATLQIKGKMSQGAQAVMAANRVGMRRRSV